MTDMMSDIVRIMRQASPGSQWAPLAEDCIRAADEIEQLRKDMLAITGYIAGVGTVFTEEGALRHIDFLPSVRAAWHVGLGGLSWEEAWETEDE
jgi:hypothetical protein